MEQPVVVGVDGSAASLRAVDWAADEAAHHGRGLRIVYATLWERYEDLTPVVGLDRPAPQILAREVLAAAERRAAARRPGLPLSQDVLAAAPVEALLSEGRSAFALVVGCRGRGPLAAAPLGSVALGVAGRAGCPTVVVRGAGPAAQGAWARVALGLAGTPQSAAAVDFAFREAAARGCELSAVHAWRRSGTGGDSVVGDDAPGAAETLVTGVLERATQKHSEVPARSDVVEGSPRRALLAAAESADLLVLGAHRREDGPGLQLGLVSHPVLQHAACPVAVVPEP
ncbi:universal stress protein [Streptomyces sp. B6B3]|uniref:universal stress protein n=1 Tax=Streptomyces sp. B6B3 TaxID=3153570 RepID=UPI00325C4EDE